MQQQLRPPAGSRGAGGSAAGHHRRLAQRTVARRAQPRPLRPGCACAAGSRPAEGSWSGSRGGAALARGRAAAAAAAAAAVAAALALQAGVATGSALAEQLAPQPEPSAQQEQLVQGRWQQQRKQQHQQQQQLLLARPPSLVQHQQHQQRQQQWEPLAELAGLFDSPKDDADPFTLYGSNFKKYEIEEMRGEKVLSRQRGFTVDSCVSAVAASQETPEFNGLPVGEKVQAGDDLLCKRATGPDLKAACKQSCATACTAALDAYEQRLSAETGYTLEPKERERILRNCRHSCSYECTKSGKAHDFVVTSRR